MPAAEQAYSMGAAVALPAADSSAAGADSSGTAQVALQKLDLNNLGSAAAASQLSSSSSSLGSREYEPAPDSSEDAAAYWPSSVSGGAAAGDSEDYPF